MSSGFRITAGCLLGLVFSGCGGPSAPPPAASTEAPPAAPAAATPAPAANVSSPPAAVKNEGGKETKWIGTIPYDVFYDQPLSIASDATVIASANPSVGSVPPVALSGTPSGNPVAGSAMSTPKPADAAASTPAAVPTGTVDWGAVMPMAMLVEETKLLRTRLTGNLQTVATFNKNTKAIETDAAILTALAAVATVHPEKVNWKPNAKYLRDLGLEVSSSANGTGREPFTKTKEPFEKLTIILDGGKPPEMESKDIVPFAEVAYLAEMMKRIETTFSNLKANFNTPARLKEDPAAVERELRMMTLLGTMMADASYDSAAEEGYQKLTQRFVSGSKEALEAAKTGDLEGYQAALNKVQTTCAECHQEYRGNNSTF